MMPLEFVQNQSMFSTQPSFFALFCCISPDAMLYFHHNKSECTPSWAETSDMAKGGILWKNLSLQNKS